MFYFDYFENDFHLLPDAGPVEVHGYSFGRFYLEGFALDFRFFKRNVFNSKCLSTLTSLSANADALALMPQASIPFGASLFQAMPGS